MPVGTPPPSVDLSSSDKEDKYVQVDMPTWSKATVTQAYQSALLNRVKIGSISFHGEWSTSKYKPVFIHDCIMQPGSLAQLLGKMPPDIIPRMTPAFLPGFYPHVHAETLQPCVMQSTNDKDYVQGMLVFGEGSHGRKLINRHYRANTRRVMVDVQADIVVPVPQHERKHKYQLWRLQRRIIRAYAWIWAANVGSPDVQFRNVVPKWTLEDYIEGRLEREQALRVEDAGWIEDKVSVPGESQSCTENRETSPAGGTGHLDYDRADEFTGW
ncbi:hypothetical protein KC343_g2931 [Hortaea werneckii]|nr:hypothetical protein KC338_g5767 [Hortaea werneckii]KAI6866478.1 hypothetical protein KC323_g3940 [Hortaea werneckii]KAI7141174.1 hypothetical protein KC352_g29450 [Hortaea werneckii]KAI7348276.1 hypothetical protein KC320_g6729 [Hortaea werneckii]KAI7560595.1 hypothetical protein KC317_g9627 [Hortaea werneckii]